MRVARFAVKRYRRDRSTYYQPLGFTAYGKTFENLVRYKDKRTNQIIDWNKSTGKRTRVWVDTPAIAGGDPIDRGVMQDRRRRIGRSGLAKKAWRFVMQASKRGGVGQVMDVPYAASAVWHGPRYAPTLTLTSHLRYAGSAFKIGMGAVSRAMVSAAKEMEHKITERIDARFLRGLR
jgi:hypothetical protein